MGAAFDNDPARNNATPLRRCVTKLFALNFAINCNLVAGTDDTVVQVAIILDHHSFTQDSVLNGATIKTNAYRIKQMHIGLK